MPSAVVDSVCGVILRFRGLQLVLCVAGGDRKYKGEQTEITVKNGVVLGIP